MVDRSTFFYSNPIWIVNGVKGRGYPTVGGRGEGERRRRRERRRREGARSVSVFFAVPKPPHSPN
jgi:hypothetical protein